MKYVIQCPFCNQRYELDEFREGAEAECEKCGNAFTITMNILNMSGKTTEPVKTLSPQIPKQNKTTQPISPKTHYKMDDENASVSFLHKINKHFNHMILSIIVALLFCIFWILLAVATEKTYYEYDVRSFYPKHDIMTGEGKRVYGTDIEEEKHLFSAQEELVATIPIITTEQKNYGDSRYVTGLRSNTNTTSIIFIYRKKITVRFYQWSYWRKK